MHCVVVTWELHAVAMVPVTSKVEHVHATTPSLLVFGLVKSVSHVNLVTLAHNVPPSAQVGPATLALDVAPVMMVWWALAFVIVRTITRTATGVGLPATPVLLVSGG